MAKTVWSSSSAEEDTFVMTFARRNLDIARVYVFSLSLLFPSLIRSLEGTRIDESWNSFFFSCCIIKSLEMYRFQLVSYIFLHVYDSLHEDEEKQRWLVGLHVSRCKQELSSFARLNTILSNFFSKQHLCFSFLFEG